MRLATSTVPMTAAHRSQRLTSEEVEVELLDLLPAVRLAVDYQPVAVLGEPFLLCYLSRGGEEAAQSSLVSLAGVSGRGDGMVRHDEHVYGSLRLDVAEGGDELVAVDDVGGELAADDLHEEVVDGHETSLR